MDIAASLLSDSANNGIRPLSLEKVNRAAPQIHKWRFTSVTLASGTDQVPYYNLMADTAEGSNTLGAPTFTSSSVFSAATATRYIADNPAPLRLMHFTSATGAGAAVLLESSVLQFLRNTPDGASVRETVEMSTFVSPNRYQTGVLSIPINGEVMDGYTFVRVNSPQSAGTAAGYVLSFSWGATNDKRADVPATRAVTVG